MPPALRALRATSSAARVHPKASTICCGVVFEPPTFSPCVSRNGKNRRKPASIPQSGFGRPRRNSAGKTACPRKIVIPFEHIERYPEFSEHKSNEHRSTEGSTRGSTERNEQSHHWAAGRDRQGADRHLYGESCAHRGRAWRSENLAGAHAGAGARLRVRSNSIHARPHACRHHRNKHLQFATQ